MSHPFFPAALLGATVPPHDEALVPAVSSMGGTGHVPLCLVQHDDRSDAELRDERNLIELNQAICERDAGCRFLFTRQHFDADIEPHWQKLLAVRAALDAGCEHAVWLDSDVGLHTSRPLKLLDSFAGRPVFANSDPPPDLTPRFFQNVRSPLPGIAPRTAAMNAGIWGVANSSGTAIYSFHDTWTCSGSTACDIWANSDAFEQGSFALHLLGSSTWRPYITMADARAHNAPCADFTEAESRSALACHFLAEYKDQIPVYISSRTAAATSGVKSLGHVALAASAEPTSDLLSSQLGPMLRIFSERVAPYFSLAVHEAARPQITSTLCHIGAGDGSLASQMASRLRLAKVHAVDASAMPDAPEALVQSFNGKELPMLNSSCDVTVFAYTLHRPAAAHLTSQLLREARRVTRGYLMLAEDRAGRTVDENARNSALEPHGTFRSEREWRELLVAAGFEVHASGSMFAPSAPQIYFIARPAGSAASAIA